MRKIVTILCVIAVASPIWAADPKLGTAKPVFAPSSAPNRPNQYHAFSMRLSPDGKHLLYPKFAPEPLAQENDRSKAPSAKTPLCLLDLETGKEIQLRIAPMDPGWETVLTRFNTFHPEGKVLALFDRIDQSASSAPARQEAFQIVIYDIASGKLSPAPIKGQMVLAKWNRQGKGLIAVTSMTDLFIAAGPEFKPVRVQAKGFVQSVCPEDDVICVWCPPQPPSGPPSTQSMKEYGATQRLFLFDLQKMKEVVDLPVDPSNGQLDDNETQWTPDGKYLYYIDGEPYRTKEGQTRTQSFARVYDRKAQKEVGKVMDALPVGPGPRPSTMILRTRSQQGEEHVVLHDAETGKLYNLADASKRLICAWGTKVVYAQAAPDTNKETIYVSEIEWRE